MRSPAKSRRNFLKTSAALTGGYWLSTSSTATRVTQRKAQCCLHRSRRSGISKCGWCIRENIVAMCDVDEKKAGKRFQQFDKANKFQDFRVMLDKLDKQIDAVVISTPDHMHFHPARQATLMGKHVYCEKPLAHSAWECRQLTRPQKRNVATQLGNQRYANAGMARTVEAVRSGMIGNVTEVYCAIGGSRGMPAMPKEFPPVPSNLNWQLWQGPVKERLTARVLPLQMAFLVGLWNG